LEINKRDDKEVAEKALMKFINHLWYLSEECAVFSIFDERLINDTRKKIAERMLQEEPDKDAQKKYTIKFEDVELFLCKDLPLDLIGTNSKYLRDLTTLKIF
jgi:hypothetical protein